MVARGLHANGRSRGWTLTKPGLQLHQRIFRVALGRQKELLNGFEASELQAFCGYLVRFLKNLEQVRGSD